jgi:hypothetical protein
MPLEFAKMIEASRRAGQKAPDVLRSEIGNEAHRREVLRCLNAAEEVDFRESGRNFARPGKRTAGKRTCELRQITPVATMLAARSAFISRMGGWPNKRLYSRLNWLALS